MANLFEKDPSAILDFVVDWTAWLDEDTISTSTWIGPTTVTGTSTTALVVDDDSNTTTAATVWLSAGTAACRYRLTNRITTAGGRTDDRSIFIDVLEQ